MLTEIKGLDFELKVHDKLKWVPISEILTYKLAPADIPIAKQILKFKNHV